MSSVRLSRSTANVRLLTSARRCGVVAREQVGRADVAAGRGSASTDQLADGGGIAQAEIEPLRADRRNRVRGFADERDAVERERRAVSTAKRKRAAAGLDRDLAEDRMRAPLDLVLERGVVERGDAFGFVGSTTQTRLERAPGSGTSVNGPLSV